MTIRDLKGFRPKSEAIFVGLNIHTVDDFMAFDPFKLYALLKKEVKGTGLNFIYVIIGAREGLHWQEISRTQQEEILMRLDDMGLAPK